MKETFFWTFSSDVISTLSDLTSEGFEVDWTVRSSSDAMTSGFVIQGEISGMIEFTPEPRDSYGQEKPRDSRAFVSTCCPRCFQSWFRGGHDLSFKDCSFRLLRTSLRLQSYCKHQSCDVSYGSMPVAH